MRQAPDMRGGPAATPGLDEINYRRETIEETAKSPSAARQANCPNCGEPIAIPPSGRPKKFCSERCRKACARARVSGQKSPPEGYPTKQENRPSGPLGNQGLWAGQNRQFTPTRRHPGSAKPLEFERVNDVTLKLTDGTQINTGSGRAARPLGFVIEVLPGRWMARVRDCRSDLLPLEAAKQIAVKLYRSRSKGEPRDSIRELNLTTAAELDRQNCQQERRQAAKFVPIDLMGGRTWRHTKIDPELRRTIIETELAPAFDTELPRNADQDADPGYHADGYPRLPTFLRRGAV